MTRSAVALVNEVLDDAGSTARTPPTPLRQVELTQSGGSRGWPFKAAGLRTRIVSIPRDAAHYRTTDPVDSRIPSGSNGGSHETGIRPHGRDGASQLCFARTFVYAAFRLTGAYPGNRLSPDGITRAAATCAPETAMSITGHADRPYPARSRKLSFSVSSLDCGGRSDRDPGHPVADRRRLPGGPR